jgi:beta-glucosidase
MSFPDNFFWGAATASFQVEGGITNNDWVMAGYESRVPVCGDACDHFNRYESDFDIANELGHTAHRLSIEWARIEPVEGYFDMKAIEHYRNVLKALKKRNMTPIVTIWHFTLPIWFSERGGFEVEDSAALFARYAAFVTHQLSDLCAHFSTMNEPNVYATHGYLYGAWPPFRQVPSIHFYKKTPSTILKYTRPKTKIHNFFLYRKVEKNLIRAHIMTYRLIKQLKPHVKVSLVKHVHVFDSKKGFFSKFFAEKMQFLQTHKFLNAIKDNIDEIGLNYYRSTTYGDNKSYLQTDMGWDAQSGGIYNALVTVAKYKKPIFVAEAGVADEDDDMRAYYIACQVNAIEKAISEGINVTGHLYWSLLDNYEWAYGFEKRFGLVAVDYKTQRRTIRPSAYVYKKIIEQHKVVK